LKSWRKVRNRTGPKPRELGRSRDALSDSATDLALDSDLHQIDLVYTAYVIVASVPAPAHSRFDNTENMMTEQILLRNQMKITDGRLEPFCEAVRQAINFVEKSGPQLMVQTYIDEEDMRAVSFQLYRNSADVLRHWELSDPYIQAVSEHCTVEKLEVYGAPNEQVVTGLSKFLADGRGLIIKPLAGFSRF